MRYRERDGLGMSVRDLTELLRDPASPWTERRTRLQGWRGDDARRAEPSVRVGARQR